METELAALDKLAVLQASEGQGRSQTSMNGMNSYFEREKRKLAQNALNPMAKENEPASCKTQEQSQCHNLNKQWKQNLWKHQKLYSLLQQAIG